jgi:hypothetical protein
LELGASSCTLLPLSRESRSSACQVSGSKPKPSSPPFAPAMLTPRLRSRCFQRSHRRRPNDGKGRSPQKQNIYHVWNRKKTRRIGELGSRCAFFRQRPTHMAGRFQGYHRFRDKDGNEYGSFEVFWQRIGWFWRSRSPGSPPDGEAIGHSPRARKRIKTRGASVSPFHGSHTGFQPAIGAGVPGRAPKRSIRFREPSCLKPPMRGPTIHNHRSQCGA